MVRSKIVNASRRHPYCQFAPVVSARPFGSSYQYTRPQARAKVEKFRKEKFRNYPNTEGSASIIGGSLGYQRACRGRSGARVGNSIRVQHFDIRNGTPVLSVEQQLYSVF